jgi:hypothetical protein
MLQRVQEALPSCELRRIFADMVESVHLGFNLEEEGEVVEKSLLELESEMRACAKGDPSGLLSPKVINLRKEVER